MQAVRESMNIVPKTLCFFARLGDREADFIHRNRKTILQSVQSQRQQCKPLIADVIVKLSGKPGAFFLLRLN